LALSRIRI